VAFVSLYANPGVGDVSLAAGVQAGPISRSVTDNKTSYGDITFVPGMFYWNNGANWHFAQGFYVVAPVGDYDEAVAECAI
jgi:hypothetical protein